MSGLEKPRQTVVLAHISNHRALNLSPRVPEHSRVYCIARSRPAKQGNGKSLDRAPSLPPKQIWATMARLQDVWSVGPRISDSPTPGLGA